MFFKNTPAPIMQIIADSPHIKLFTILFPSVQKNPTTYTFFIIFTSRLVPSRSAPSSINFSASAKEEIPPAAFTFTFVPTYCLISSTSEKVAPAVENPVEVLMNSAPGTRHDLTHLDFLLICQKACLNDHF